MDFSAFLGPPMKKKHDPPKLRTVDESPEEKVSALDAVVVDKNEEKVRLEAKDRSELKFRTHEPKLEELVDQSEVTLEDEWSVQAQPPRIHKGLWISIGMILVLGVAWLVFEIMQLKKPEVAVQVDPVNLKELEKQAERDAIQTVATIQDVVRRFYRAETVEEMLKHVRHAERVGPMMLDHYTRNPLQASEVVSVVDMNPLMIGTHAGFRVVLTKMSNGVDGKLVVEVMSPVDAKVDWETHVCAQPMDWERFVKDRPAGYRGDFRVYAEREDFYNYEFADSTKYQAFKLTTLHSYEVIYGYAPRDGQAFRVIDQLLVQNNDQKVPVLLRLHLQDGLQSKSGVLIEDIIAPRWLLVDSPEVKK